MLQEEATEEKPEQTQEATNIKKKLCVFNLPWSLSAANIKNLFGQCVTDANCKGKVNFQFPDGLQTFNEVQKLLSKTKGKLVGELMTPTPMVVRETTNLEDATRLLLETKFRRLPVVDADGKLVRDSCPSIVQRPW
ncbi:hypothetical protein K1719_013382 [Acacia pycnantha]|nr:hypothetical protein K1719_013382 [Acacia pycnantha]